MKVIENASHTKDPLVRLYDDKVNEIRLTGKFEIDGRKVGEWCDLEVLSSLNSAGLVKDDIIQGFTIVYRCYETEVTVYFDSITITGYLG